mmetsp:Transcript_23224/g.59513  ORF Transcript_23224/g.59513 Transcript_23224/m.59513 type:complete len:222 (+) Transcript_23224:232-897(+)
MTSGGAPSASRTTCASPRISSTSGSWSPQPSDMPTSTRSTRPPQAELMPEDWMVCPTIMRRAPGIAASVSASVSQSQAALSAALYVRAHTALFRPASSRGTARPPSASGGTSPHSHAPVSWLRRSRPVSTCFGNSPPCTNTEEPTCSAMGRCAKKRRVKGPPGESAAARASHSVLPAHLSPAATWPPPDAPTPQPQPTLRLAARFCQVRHRRKSSPPPRVA